MTSEHYALTLWRSHRPTGLVLSTARVISQNRWSWADWLTLYGSNADLLDRLGKHGLGKGCLYVTKLEDVDLDVLRQLIGRGWTDVDTPTDSHPHALVEPVEPPH